MSTRTIYRPTYAPAVAEAVARCRRDGGPLDVVRWTNPNGEQMESIGLPPYDALGLAKDLVWNQGPTAVTLTTATGRVLDEDAIAKASY
jgi:hypothetical protein